MPRKLLLLILHLALCGQPALAASDQLEQAFHLSQSRVHMKAGDYPAAIEAYEKLLQINPDSQEAMKGIAYAFEKQGNIEQAIERYDRYLAQNPDDAKTLFKQAEFLSQPEYSKRRSDAIRYLQMGLELEDNSRERIKYARLLTAEGADPELALKQYENLLAQMQDNPTIRREYRDLLLSDRRFLDKAIIEYDAMVAEDSSNSANRRQLAQLLGQTEARREQAVEIYASLVEAEPADPGLRHDYARLLAGADASLIQAQQQYRLLLEQQPDYVILNESAALMARDAATADEAIELYNRMLQQRPEDVSARLQRANLYMQQATSTELALRDYQQVIELDRQNAAAHRGAATALALLGRSDQALYEAKLALASAAEDVDSSDLRDQLSRGREPRLKPLIDIVNQGGGAFEYDAKNYAVEFTADASPFMTVNAAVGYEDLDNDTVDASDDWWRLGVQYRFADKRKLDVSIADHAVRDLGSSMTGSLVFSDLSQEQTDWHYRVGYQSLAVKDSLLSWLGDAGLGLDPATRDQIIGEIRRQDAQRRLAFNAAFGRVDNGLDDDNQFLSLSASIAYPAQRLPLVDGWLADDADAWIGLDASYQAYEDDRSGFSNSSSEPLLGGYFSPQNLADIFVFAEITQAIDSDAHWHLILGPRLQFIDDASDDEHDLSLAGALTLNQQTRAGNQLQLKLEHNETGDRFRTTAMSAQWVYIFD